MSLMVLVNSLWLFGQYFYFWGSTHTWHRFEDLTSATYRDARLFLDEANDFRPFLAYVDYRC